jgi:hypothetical protein
MEYGYSFDDEAPRYELRTLWFLLGVVVFAFSVLIVASIVNGAGSGRVHLSEPTTRQEQIAPAKAPASRGVSPGATPLPARPLNNKGG